MHHLVLLIGARLLLTDYCLLDCSVMASLAPQYRTFTSSFSGRHARQTSDTGVRAPAARSVQEVRQSWPRRRCLQCGPEAHRGLARQQGPAAAGDARLRQDDHQLALVGEPILDALRARIV